MAEHGHVQVRNPLLRHAEAEKGTLDSACRVLNVAPDAHFYHSVPRYAHPVVCPHQCPAPRLQILARPGSFQWRGHRTAQTAWPASQCEQKVAVCSQASLDETLEDVTVG